jgi:hypothetical protein
MAVLAPMPRARVKTAMAVAGSAGEHAEGVFQIAKGDVEPADEIQVAWGFVGGLGHRNPRSAKGKDEEIR